MKLVHDYRQFIKFVLVAGSYNVMAYMVYASLVYARCNYFVASVISFAFGMCMSYYMNKVHVYKNRGGHHKLPLYLAYYITLLGVNLLLLYSFTHYFNFNPYMAQMIVIALVALISYHVLHLLFSEEKTWDI